MAHNGPPIPLFELVRELRGPQPTVVTAETPTEVFLVACLRSFEELRVALDIVAAINDFGIDLLTRRMRLLEGVVDDVLRWADEEQR